jgi:hypothetical protein
MPVQALEEISCIFGHHGSDLPAIEENGFTARRCDVCGLIYISPRPNSGEIFDLYSHDKAHLPAAEHLAHDKTAALAAKHHLKYIKRAKPPRDSLGNRRALLEIGCGGGHFSAPPETRDTMWLASS